ncbi:methylthioribose-1-phosphate isomerase [Streptoalloteichus tenebrarius]|uniref:Methylthioribose-1-phosphate isomerase n=1 Tax=Streptoalloteichus tenebrarius (strain ATCC 17920 / DSM 40477 / JCM 4838 / CBS 697.72 / NBRC 16177 / NCIMB 11028 / NRRL B-12390 / A12253. 1 / ISP 5477) TaxID=1933 RepID=A0ABT1I3A3_STRSD|nr:methylthioribose-1-phosphate isomerase [Streptoalloteichus tenebrarius]BFF01305.1 S-methyl-5-thioribose-1-phosphate isomerase [Streptoalloteichus tenebrarius]
MEWVDGHILTIDQTRLPEITPLRLSTVDDVVDAIRRLAVRGAPLIGVTGALGVALAARHAAEGGYEPRRVRADAERIASARPTAVNLRWAVNQVLPHVEAGPDAVLAAALELLEADVRTNEALARRGAALLRELVGDRPMSLHTHCHTGAFACVAWGTALGIVRALHEDGLVRQVLADETRPLLQGARITATELSRMGVDHRVVVDGAGPGLIARGLVDAVVVGADRVAANGDVANKVGTYPLALAAARAGVPFVVAAPESTVDPDTPDGAAIEIEERDGDEVLAFAGRRTTPEGSGALNPAFDVTPADLVTAVVTEKRVVRPAAGERMAGE